MNQQRPLNAALFIKNRKKPLSITNERISHIIWYLAECYSLLYDDKVVYSKTLIRSKTTITIEDYLKMEFVDKYLIPNKRLLSSKLPALEQINFGYETQKRYIDHEDQKEKPDKIDIFISKLGLQGVWDEHDEFVYLAVECKRLKNLSSASDYVGDIRKFCNRQYIQLRLPMEAMIGFIETKKVTHQTISVKINEVLKKQSDIQTIQNLKIKTQHPIVNSIYDSIHTKSINNAQSFSITHLLFDFSSILVN